MREDLTLSLSSSTGGIVLTAPRQPDVQLSPRTHSQLVVRRLGPHRWQLVEPFVYRGNEDTFVVPAGFETDFASVPQIVQSLLPRTGAVDEAAVLHDRHCKQLAAGDCEVTSVDADGLFRQGLRVGGMDPVRAWLYWTGVRWGAAKNPDRRDGWRETAAAVLAISAVVAVVLTVLVTAFVLGLLDLVGVR